MNNQEREAWAWLLAYLGRGGQYQYFSHADFTRGLWFKVGEPPAALPDEGQGVYFGVHPTRDLLKNQYGYGRPKIGNDDVAAVNCLYADLDADKLNGIAPAEHVKALEPALLSARPAPKVRVEVGGPAAASVQWMARTDDAGALYVLLANPDPKEVASVRVPVAPGTEVSILDHHGLTPLPGAKNATVRGVSLDPMGAATLVIRRNR